MDIRKVYIKEAKTLLPIFDSELEKTIPFDHWKILKQQNWGTVAIHTINALYRTICDPIYV